MSFYIIARPGVGRRVAGEDVRRQPHAQRGVLRDFKDTVFTFLRIILTLFEKCMV